MTTTTTTTRTDETTQTLCEARTQDVVDLKRLVRHLDALMTDVPVVIDTDGIRFRTADAAMVALVELQLKPDLFGRFNAPANAIECTVDIEELTEYITDAKQGDDVTLTVVEDDDGYQLQISIWHDGITTTFTMPTAEPPTEDEEEFGTDALAYERSALVALDQLIAGIENMDTSVEIALDAETLSLASTDGDNSAAVEIPATSDYLHAVHVAEPATSLFSVDYLMSFKKLKRTIDRVQIELGDDYPVRFTADEDRFRYQLYIAPRIEET